VGVAIKFAKVNNFEEMHVGFPKRKGQIIFGIIARLGLNSLPMSTFLKLFF
jgi:hypothetical protein|tara:strand:- start:1071 stop:1223 length:153 start_codon:yes stop_codon:yes gene_type:complete